MDEPSSASSPSGGAGSASSDIAEVTKAYALKVEELTLEDEKTKYRKTSRKEAEKLAGCGIDMTERAVKGKMDPVIGRKKEIEKVVQVLSRRQKTIPYWLVSRALVRVRLSKDFPSSSLPTKCPSSCTIKKCSP